MGLYVGTSGYSYPEWKGDFYPDDLPQSRMLGYYGGQFGCVEINNTFHRMPRPELLQNWAAQVQEDFRFALKAPQRITHLQRLQNVGDPLSYFFDVAAVLGERLGPILFQLPPSLKKDLVLLKDFLAQIPRGRRVALQFQHRSWLDDDVFAAMQRGNAALCIADVEDGLEIPFVSCADWGYLRLRRPDYGDAELARWAALVRGREWGDAYIFFKHEEAALGPKFARRFLELWSAGAGTTAGRGRTWE